MRVLFYYRESESIGVEYLIAMLKRDGHEVGLLFEAGLSAKYGMANFNLLRRLDSVDEEIYLQAQRFNPQLVALSSDSYLYPRAKEIIRLLKARLRVPVIIGGVHASSLADFVIEDSGADMLCVGEGEYALRELVNKMETGEDYSRTENIWIKRGKEVVRNGLRPLIQDLDSLPFPDRKLFYQAGAFRHHLMIIGSRGCPYQCTYCHNSFDRSLYDGKGRYVRKRSVENILSEIGSALAMYPIRGIEFEDEIFTLPKEWISEFIDKYPERFKLPFWCQARPEHIDTTLAKKLKDIGCVEMFMGVDSGDDDIRNRVLKRNVSREKMIEGARAIKDARIRLQVTGMFAIPDETPEQMWKTVELIDEIKPSAMPTYTFYPFPETELTRYAREKGYLDDSAMERIKNGSLIEGKGGCHSRSVLSHPYRDNAYNISKLLSLYVRSPWPLKPLIKRLMFSKGSALAELAYTLCLPFDYPFYGWERIRLFLAGLPAGFRKIIRRKKLTHPVLQDTVRGSP